MKKIENVQLLVAAHAQCSAVCELLQAIIESEDTESCQHENAVDQSTMGMAPQERMYCPDCNSYFKGEVKQ